MRQPLVLGNWKMNGSLEGNRGLLQSFIEQWQGRAQVGVCPPAVYLSQVSELIKSSELGLGGQDVSKHSAGAYTGELAGPMLVEAGCTYALVGHSERREYHGETNEDVADKFAAALDAGLIPVLCVGESLQEREEDRTIQVIAAQLEAVITKVGAEAFTKAVVAYEPVWAIGTGKTATPEQAQEVHDFIRLQFGPYGEQVQVLYGGSVKPDNAEELFSQKDIDGALVGGASLKAEDFLAICSAADART